MLKPICVRCQRFYRPKKNGFPVIEQMPSGDGATPGTSTPELWEPYKLWMGDLWECQGCLSQIVVGIIHQQPVSEHFQPDFEKWVKDVGATFKVNDC